MPLFNAIKKSCSHNRIILDWVRLKGCLTAVPDVLILGRIFNIAGMISNNDIYSKLSHLWAWHTSSRGFEQIRPLHVSKFGRQTRHHRKITSVR